MIDGGIILFFLAAVLAFAGPTEKLIIGRRNCRVVMIANPPPLKSAFPVAPASRSLGELMHEAAAALDADDLMRGMHVTGEIYQIPPST